MENDFLDDERVKLFKIERESLWGGSPRNAGISKATGDYVIYLDIDDEYMSMYLKNLSEEIVLKGSLKDWYYVDDYIYTPSGYALREADINKQGRCGTSNVLHKPDLGVYWPKKGTYAHDYNFINVLKAMGKRFGKLDTSGYIVQHIPGSYDR
jgi:glycosyltransferase involved in cell wall biosynthesis